MQKPLVGRPALEVLAATQQQGLLDGALEAVMALLGVAVLVGLPDLDGLAGHAVVGQQRPVTLREQLGVSRLMDRQTHAVGAVLQRYAAQLPQGILKGLAEALETLRETKSNTLPVGVGEDKVVGQVVQRHALDGDAQAAQVGEIGSAQAAGRVQLSEEDFAGRPLGSPPVLDATLQGAQLSVGETSRIAALQLGEERLGLQAGGAFELCLEFVPDLGKGVRARAPGVLPGEVAGEFAGAAVLASGLAIHASLRRCYRQ